MKQKRFPNKIFVTGTDTGIGKTLVSAILVAGLKGEYWKPVQSGIEDVTDTQWIKQKTGFTDDYFHPETYNLKLPLSPHASAVNDGVRIDLEFFRIPENRKSNYLIIEGAGGIMVPLNEKHFILDLIKKFNIPTLLVSSSSLGTINHTLLSLEQLRRHGLEVMGVVMNGEINSINREAIERFGKVNVLAEIKKLTDITLKTLIRAFRENFMPKFERIS
ncbi:dethiobiotin synthase [Thermodesulfobacteriota bacterium]